MVHYVAKICGYSSFSKKENLSFFLSSEYKAQCTMLWFSQFHFINKSIFNSTKRNSRQPDWAIFHEQHLKENNLHQRQEHWSVVSMVVTTGLLCALFTLLSEPTLALSTDWTSLMHLLGFMLARDRKWSRWSGWAPLTIKTTRARKTFESLPYQRSVLTHTVKPTTLVKSETVRNYMHTLLWKSQRLFCLHMHYQQAFGIWTH